MLFGLLEILRGFFQFWSFLVSDMVWKPKILLKNQLKSFSKCLLHFYIAYLSFGYFQMNLAIQYISYVDLFTFWSFFELRMFLKNTIISSTQITYSTLRRFRTSLICLRMMSRVLNRQIHLENNRATGTRCKSEVNTQKTIYQNFWFPNHIRNQKRPKLKKST